jgi:hypothetical protein
MLPKGMTGKRAAILSLALVSLCLGSVAIWKAAHAPPALKWDGPAYGPWLPPPPPMFPPPPRRAEAKTLVRSHSFVSGPESAPVTIVEFLDPQGAASRAVHPAVKAVAARHGERVRLVIRYLPLESYSALAAASLEEAREIGKLEPPWTCCSRPSRSGQAPRGRSPSSSRTTSRRSASTPRRSGAPA